MTLNEFIDKLISIKESNNAGNFRVKVPYYFDIEYIRTDAFIEKAEKFLEAKLTEKDCKFSWGEWTKVKSGYNPITSFMREFRMYMKGE